MTNTQNQKGDDLTVKLLVGDYYGCDMTPVTISKEKWEEAHNTEMYFSHKLDKALREVDKYKSFLETAKYQEELQSVAIFPNKLESIAKKYNKTIKIEVDEN